MKRSFLCGLLMFLRLCYDFESGIIKNSMNLVKKLLPLTDLTIIINGLVIRINSCQY
jgi:hypothetical protein